MAAGKAGVEFEIDRVNLFIGEYKILDKEQIKIILKDVADYMKQTNLEITIEINKGNKSFTVTQWTCKNTYLVQIIEFKY